MAVVQFPKIQEIILSNPNKAIIAEARIIADKLMLHVFGKGLSSALQRSDYFENEDVFKVRNKDAVSNRDLFTRILQREEMVFTAKGGSSYYKGLSPEQTIQMDATLDQIRFNMTIRKWVKEFALKAYRVDPMSVLFIEVDNIGNIYPTYKSIDSVYDYKTNGRKLEYVCFRLKAQEVRQFYQDMNLSIPTDIADIPGTKYTQYYRFVDDAEDRICKSNGVTVTEENSIKIAFSALPAIIASDIIDFNNTQCFLSPIEPTIELAHTYLNDRSIRDLSKKYSGFPKGYEPLLTCSTCLGTGLLAAKACPECSEAGATRGTGYKLRTKVSDVARFPLPKEGQTGGVSDPSKFFGYISPDIKTWDKQDTSLVDIENLMQDVYWGTVNKQSTTGPTTSQGNTGSFQETATKTLADLQPIYARLNETADWAEGTENALCQFIGEYLFPGSFKKSTRTYGRYYILETPDELIEEYLDMKTKGAPQATLFDTLRKYYHSVYANDPVQLAIKLKLINIEPFVHQTVVQVQAANPSRIDFFMKMYFSEWLATKDDNYLLASSEEALLADLTLFATSKMVEPAELLVPPTVGISETVRNIN